MRLDQMSQQFWKAVWKHIAGPTYGIILFNYYSKNMAKNAMNTESINQLIIIACSVWL